jgi:hypothetical protein
MGEHETLRRDIQEEYNEAEKTFKACMKRHVESSDKSFCRQNFSNKKKISTNYETKAVYRRKKTSKFI